MQVVPVTMPVREAKKLYQQYRSHAAYSKPMEREIQAAYYALTHGRAVIRALESIKQAGLNRDFLPKLAIAPATAEFCHLRRARNGSIIMSPDPRFWHFSNRQHRMAENTFNFPHDSFPMNFDGRSRGHSSEHKSKVPVIPSHLKPKRGLANYHVLWEAEWERIPPSDPYLLRRIGKSDLWVVVAHWDLTEIEKAVLATRL